MTIGCNIRNSVKTRASSLLSILLRYLFTSRTPLGHPTRGWCPAKATSPPVASPSRRQVEPNSRFVAKAKREERPSPSYSPRSAGSILHDPWTAVKNSAPWATRARSSIARSGPSPLPFPALVLATGALFELFHPRSGCSPLLDPWTSSSRTPLPTYRRRRRTMRKKTRRMRAPPSPRTSRLRAPPPTISRAPRWIPSPRPSPPVAPPSPSPPS